MNDLEELSAVELLSEHDNNTIGRHAYRGLKTWQDLQDKTGDEIIRRMLAYEALKKYVEKAQKRQLTDLLNIKGG